MIVAPPPNPPATVTDTASWQQWDIYIRYRELVAYEAWMAAGASDAALVTTFTKALLSDWDWAVQSKAAPASVVATAQAMAVEFRKTYPAPPL